MIGPGSLLSDFRCPSCNALQPARRIWRTSHHRGVFFPVEAGTPCTGCGINLRLSEHRKTMATVLGAAVFLISVVMGLLVARLFDGLTYIAPSGATRVSALGYVLVMAFLVYPSVTLCNRVRRLEIVE